MVGSPGSSGLPRLGLVVSKGSGNAVTRNRIKRRLRHASDRLQWRQDLDYVIIADRRVADVGFADLEGWLEAAVQELASA